jgi:multidrug transporter EmrE-like cation transporter
MQLEWAYIIVVSICWGGYPLIARASGHGGPVGALVLTLAGLVPISLAALSQVSHERASLAAIQRLGSAGVLMGIGLIAFNLVVNSRLNASVSIPLVNAAALIVSTLGALYFFNEPLSARKVLAVGLLLAGIATMPAS